MDAGMSQSENRCFCALLFLFCGMSPIAMAQRATARPLFRNNMHQLSSGQSALQGFSAPRAAPIQSSSSSGVLAPSALFAPDYCDIETLRSSATIRSIRFRNDRQGVVVGDHGLIAITIDGGITWNETRSGVECRLDDVIWTAKGQWVAVGGGYDAVTQLSRGVVVASRDGGQTWRRGGDTEMPYLWKLQTDNSPINSRSNRQVNLRATGEQDPVTGASQFESRDGGRTWQPVISNALATDRLRPKSVTAHEAAMWAKVTGAHAVIRASCRLGDNTVLAVGDHGLILRSPDDGNTWQPVSLHGKSAQTKPPSTGVLFVTSRMDRVPWALIGREALEERLRTCVLVQQRDGSASKTSAGFTSGVTGNDTAKAAAEGAAMRLGAASLEIFTQDDTTKQLSRWLETHRPPILAIDSQMDASIKTELLQKAVVAGTTKVIEFGFEERGESTLHDDAMLPSTGVLAGDFQIDARLAVTAMMSENSSATNRWTTIDIRYDAGHGSRRSELADGVRLSDQHRLPARIRKASGRRLQVVQGRLKQNELLSKLHQSDDSVVSLERSLNQLLSQTSQTDRFRLAWTFASKSSNARTRAASWKLLFDQFPGSSACQLAKLHLDARKTSVEWQRVLQSDLSRNSQSARVSTATAGFNETHPSGVQRNDIRLASGETLRELTPQGGVHSTIVSPFQQPSPSGSVIQVGAQSPTIASPLAQPAATAQSPSVLSSSTTDSTINSQPAIDLAWQVHPMRLIVADAAERARVRAERFYEIEQGMVAASRPTGDHAPADALVADDVPFTGHDSSGPDGLSADLRRTANRNTPWSPLLQTSSPQARQATHASKPPRLDGVLDETWWQQDARPDRRPTNPGPRVAYDDRFVYLAIKIPLPETPSQRFDKSEIGKRDADLRSANRTRVQLDLDRDLLTGFELQFTVDGRTRDTIDGDTRWDPIWYVASKQTGDHVTTEIAIEQSSLGSGIEPGDQWFINLETFEAGQAERHRWMPEPTSRIRVDF